MKYQKVKKNTNIGKILKAAMLIAVLYFAYLFFFGDRLETPFSDAKEKRIFFEIDESSFEKVSDAKTVGEFLQEIELEITDNDFIFPAKDQRINFGSRIYAKKARKMIVLEGGKEKEFQTLKTFVGEAVREKTELGVGEYDIIEPDEKTFVSEGVEISITHVKVEKETEEESIAFKTVENKDDKLGWREKKVTTKGEKGIREVVYEVVYHDGKEIKRKKIEEKIVKEPISEVVTQGTFVKLGKTHTGLATWYDQGPHPNLRARFPFKGDMFAANPWLPLGSYARVTNKANGKSVIVRINDRGPFGENRILDLNKPAFAAIASIGAGIIDVKMEEIKN